MARVYISCGSNIEPQKHLLKGLQDLEETVGKLCLSPVYESTAVGFQGDNFLNLVVAFDTELDILAVDQLLENIEKQNGRQKSNVRFSSRNIDFDLLLYDDLIYHNESLEIPRPEIYQNAFVLRPLADIAPDVLDPLSQQSFAILWQQFSDPSQKLWLHDTRNWLEQSLSLG